PVAAAMVTLVAVSVAISCLNLLNQYTALTIATNADYTRALGKAGSDTLTLLFTDMQRNGGLINTIFFGLWLLPLGWLVIKSGYFPKLLGILLIAGCFGWLALFFAHYLAPDLGKNIAPFVDILDGIAELSFIAWLLAIGVRVRVPQAGSPALADSPHGSAVLTEWPPPRPVRPSPSAADRALRRVAGCPGAGVRSCRGEYVARRGRYLRRAPRECSDHRSTRVDTSKRSEDHHAHPLQAGGP